jgi:phosphoenolpyruvate carboxylase
MTDYKRLGYSDNWINQRLKSIEIRKELTDEWKKHGLQEGVEIAILTDVIYKTWADKTAKEYKQLKGLKKENLRDNMTNKELVLNMLAELSTKEISEVIKPQFFNEHKDVAKRGGNVAKEARLKLESETGKKVVTSLNAKQLQLPQQDNPLH